jgi:hypothetical protein
MLRLFWVQLILFIGITSAAQHSADTSSALMPYPVTVYYDALGEQSPLYNGREYVDYANTIQAGHPFYQTTGFVKGSIHYDGMKFEHAMILYDIIKDKVLILHFNNVFRIDLPVEKIREFRMLDHHFIRLLEDSAHVIEEGFYDKLYEGKISLFAKRKKLIIEERTGNDLIRAVDEKSFFYIQKQGRYYPVKTLKSLLNVLNNRREEIRQNLTKNGIKFRKDRENAILKSVQYYDRLSN